MGSPSTTSISPRYSAKNPGGAKSFARDSARIAESCRNQRNCPIRSVWHQDDRAGRAVDLASWRLWSGHAPGLATRPMLASWLNPEKEKSLTARAGAIPGKNFAVHSRVQQRGPRASDPGPAVTHPEPVPIRAVRPSRNYAPAATAARRWWLGNRGLPPMTVRDSDLRRKNRRQRLPIPEISPRTDGRRRFVRKVATFNGSHRVAAPKWPIAFAPISQGACRRANTPSWFFPVAPKIARHPSENPGVALFSHDNYPSSMATGPVLSQSRPRAVWGGPGALHDSHEHWVTSFNGHEPRTTQQTGWN